MKKKSYFFIIIIILIMKTINFLKIISNKNKIKIIAHFYKCFCKKFCVQKLEKKLNISQSLNSKVITSLYNEKILSYEKNGRKKYYFINKEFKKQWGNIIELILSKKDLKDYKCQCKK